MHIEKISAMVHPGRILLEEFLAPRGIGVARLATEISLSARRIYELIQEQRSINADLAHRLAHYFGMSERYWRDLQTRYDREQVSEGEKYDFPIQALTPLGGIGKFWQLLNHLNDSNCSNDGFVEP